MLSKLKFHNLIFFPLHLLPEYHDIVNCIITVTSRHILIQIWKKIENEKKQMDDSIYDDFHSFFFSSTFNCFQNLKKKKCNLWFLKHIKLLLIQSAIFGKYFSISWFTIVRFCLFLMNHNVLQVKIFGKQKTNSKI